MTLNQKGWTLVELLAILIILAVLFTVIAYKHIDFTEHADAQRIEYQNKALERYEVVKSTGLETGKESDE